MTSAATYTMSMLTGAVFRTALGRRTDFAGTPIRYRDGDTVPARFNLDRIVATPDERFLLVAQTNTRQLFRIEVATREVVKVEGGGNLGGEGMTRLGDCDLLVIDMTRSPTLTRRRLSHEWTRYAVVSRRDARGNVFPTSSVVAGEPPAADREPDLRRARRRGAGAPALPRDRPPAFPARRN